MENDMYNYYDDMPGIMADLEVGCENLQMMVENGEYERVNRYIAAAIEHMKIALANLSDAEFHLTTGG